MSRSTLWPYWRLLRAQALEESRALRLLLVAHGRMPAVVSWSPPDVVEWRVWRRQEQDRSRRDRG